MNNLCIIPACGYATRIGGIPKFLLPISNNETLLKRHVTLALEAHLKIVIITRDELFPMVKEYVESNFSDCLSMINLEVDSTETMSETVLNCINRQSEQFDNFVLSMPDSYISDNHYIHKMVDALENNKFSAVASIFKIKETQKGKLGQVDFDSSLTILDVKDKNKDCDYDWAWFSMAWNSSFIRNIDKSTPHVGYAMNDGLRNNESMTVVKVESRYFDCGDIFEYRELLNTIY